MATNDGVRPGLEGRIERVVDERLITMHLGGKGVFATPGSTVVVTATLTEVKDNKLYFDVSCELDGKVIGTGTHKRAIVPANF